MIRADIETEIAPLVGTEKQSEELVSYLLKELKMNRKNCGSRTSLESHCMNW